MKFVYKSKIYNVIICKEMYKRVLRFKGGGVM